MDVGKDSGHQRRPVPLVTRSLSSFPRRSSWWSSLFSLTSRACSALYGSRTESRLRLSPSALPADSLALRRLSVVWTRSLRETQHHVTQERHSSSHRQERGQGGGEGEGGGLPEQLLHQRQRLDAQRLSVAQLVQTLPQVDALPLGAVHCFDSSPLL